MTASAHDHFKGLFKDCNDFVVCIDDKLNIIYTTNKVISIFCKNSMPLLHLNNIFSTADCNRVRFAANGGVHAVSFDFTSVCEKAPRSCLVIPTQFMDAYYFVLHISNTKVCGIDKLQKQDIEAMVNTAASTIADCTAPIVEIAGSLPNSAGNTLKSNINKIRKVFAGIELAMANQRTALDAPVIELYSYMSALLLKVENRLGKRKFSYTLLPCQDMYMTRISPADLDVMAVCLISEMIIAGGGQTHVNVTVCGDSVNCFIIISNSDSGLSYTPGELLSESTETHAEITSGRIITARTALSKLARESGGKAFFTQTFGGGITHGIMLKKSKTRKATLYEEPDGDAHQNARLDVLLSDI